MSSSSSGNYPVVVNELLLKDLHRSDLFSIYSCRAWNSNLTSSITSSVTLDMNLKPVEVKIVSFKRSLTSGEKTEVICQSRGARPPATLNWFLNNEPVTHFVSQSFSEDGNLTTSILNFVPFPSADGQVLKCQSESAITGQVFMTEEDEEGEDSDGGSKTRAEGNVRMKGKEGEDTNAQLESRSSNRSTSTSTDPVIDASYSGTSLTRSPDQRDDELMKKKTGFKSRKEGNSTAKASDSSSSLSGGSFSNVLTDGNPVSSSVSKSISFSSKSVPDSSKSGSKKSGRRKSHHAPPHEISDEWRLQIFCKFLFSPSSSPDAVRVFFLLRVKKVRS